MNLFNFHHHNLGNFYGIYNLELGENVPESYFSVGIHPKNIDNGKNILKHLRKFRFKTIVWQ
jgi:TatD DNase family protein